jgi:asparagine synthase (glutamine-hydrolysing)
MGDFLLDFRSVELRRPSAAQAATLLKFCGDTWVKTLERDAFSLVLTRVDEPELWAPFEHRSAAGDILVALAGRIALDEPQWDAAKKIAGEGGLACKAIFDLYRTGGVAALGSLGGNFVAFIHDASTQKFHFVTDRCGMYLAYGKVNFEKTLVFGSHPDVLAAALGESRQWDMASLAEFLMTSRLSFPQTYYQNIRALDPGCIYSIKLPHGQASFESKQCYFRFDFQADPNANVNDLAEQLAAAFRKAVQRRTLPIFGPVGVGLSGGLDSRAILSSADPRTPLRAFSLFDEENAEFRTARAIAASCDVEMIPIRRDFDHYGNSAELGVRISGGTGCITCNHFLAVREQLRGLGLRNILTGCYCDYLFKGLALNRTERRITRSDALAGFQFEFYDPYHRLETQYREQVMNRLKAQFPESTRPQLTDLDWLEVERKRSFPLAYEQDLAQRVIPQRVMPWYVPIADNDLVAAYLKIPPRHKLNASVFKKMLPSVCPPKVCRVPDSNTGAPVNASWPSYAFHRCSSALRNRIGEKLFSRMATTGSWPNWRHYVCRSKVIESLWNRPNPTAKGVFTEILGHDPFRKSIAEHATSDLVLFQRLFTQKIWLDQQAG